MLFLVTGGGTGGHVNPALSVAAELVGRGHDVHYVGAAGGKEATLVPPTGLPLTLLPGRGIQRSVHPKAIVANVAAAWGIVRAFLTAIGLVRRLRPAAVLAVGGFASVPCALAAVLWRVPLVVAEQNTHPGVANRLSARFAKASAVAFEGTPLRRAVVTGNPIRAEIVAGTSPEDARAALGVPAGRRLVLVAGGSLGALSINKAVVALAEAWAGRDDVCIRHAVGSRDWPAFEGRGPLGDVYVQVEYEHEMPTAMAAAEVAVCRSGSGTCFELAAAGLPAVLVPSPFVTGDHQTGNAERMAEAGGAVVVADADLTGARLATELDALLADPERLASMAAALRTLARPDAAAAIADLLVEHARDRS